MFEDIYIFTAIYIFWHTVLLGILHPSLEYVFPLVVISESSKTEVVVISRCMPLSETQV